mmetsp:Transcript_27837/g.67092  ORF Transcript_27837/g.67092 Transcript_27837/m.67092 type:complete len:200 (+) Transcript_27837:426-1025(+)
MRSFRFGRARLGIREEVRSSHGRDLRRAIGRSDTGESRRGHEEGRGARKFRHPVRSIHDGFYIRHERSFQRQQRGWRGRRHGPRVGDAHLRDRRAIPPTMPRALGRGQDRPILGGRCRGDKRLPPRGDYGRNGGIVSVHPLHRRDCRREAAYGARRNPEVSLDPEPREAHVAPVRERRRGGGFDLDGGAGDGPGGVRLE